MTHPLEIPGFHSPDEAGFEEIVTRLKSVTKTNTNLDLSRALGLQRAAVGAAKRRHIVPASWLVEAARRFGASVSWILTGGQADQDNDDFCILPVLEMKLGSDGDLIKGNSNDSQLFKRSWIETKGQPKDLFLLQMTGLSMMPLIHDKDLVLVNSTEIEPKSESDIHIVSFNQSVFVRRISMEPGKIILRAENRKLVPDVSVCLDDAGMIKILGRVIWWAHEVA